MVDALREAHRILRPGGLLVDARPDSRVLAKLRHAGRTVGTVGTQRVECTDDRSADDAIAVVKRERLFRRVRTGRLWHHLPFADLPGAEGYLREHLRFRHHADWSAAASVHRREWRGDPFTLVRAVRFEVLERS